MSNIEYLHVVRCHGILSGSALGWGNIDQPRIKFCHI